MAKVKLYKPEAPAAPKEKRAAKNIDKAINSTLFDDFDRFEHFFIDHWRGFCWVGGVIVAAVAIWGIVRLSTLRSDEAVAARLNSAVTIPELVAAIDEFSPSDIRANNARLRLAALLTTAGEYAEASTLLEAVLATDCPAEERLIVRLNQAYLLETSGHTAEAAALFNAIGGDAYGDLPADAIQAQADFCAGRLYLALGEPERARDALLRGLDTTRHTTAEAAAWVRQSAYLYNTLGK